MEENVILQSINFDIGSLLSNTLITLAIIGTIVFLIHSWLKYSRLYKHKEPETKR
jgi:hypothetical protein